MTTTEKYLFRGDFSHFFGTVRMRRSVAAVLAAWLLTCVIVTTTSIVAAIHGGWLLLVLEIALACWSYWRAIESVLSLLDVMFGDA
jgi:ABC-type transporter Mla maintaining outer membrane lipid asymmetry permease subunit MlaE